uniref:Phenoloxidase-activating factor 2 n=1 Tax=Homalodisca liturata TaxID=320908 RepID=A0A1B6HKB4_9HEMI
MRLAALWVCVMAQQLLAVRGEDQVAPELGPKRVVTERSCECVPVYRCQFKTSTDGSGSIDIRVDRQGCPGLLDVCCPFTITRPPPATLSCGVQFTPRQVETRITGDDYAHYGQYPWMAALLAPGRKYVCGGSLIHRQVVLTAAHCVHQVRLQELTVRLGEWDSQHKTETYPVQNVGAVEIVIHEQFKLNSLFNDIALVFLASPAELGGNIRTICLPEANEIVDSRKCLASGWGKDAFGREGKHSAILKSVQLSLMPREECLQALRETRLGEFFRLHISFLCAGGEKGRDTCKGDGGSPLVCPTQQNSGVYLQAGIVSWGIDCGQEAPAAYTNVALFRSWIDLQLLRRGLLIDH